MAQLTRRRLLQALSSPLLVPAAWPALAHEGHAASATEAPRLSAAAVQLPALALTRQDGQRLPLERALDNGRPLLLNFIYTSCTAICPVLSQVFAEVRDRLGEQRHQVQFVSISIDPEQDTPRRLREYAARFGADEGWSFYTGSAPDCAAVQQSFGIFRGDKMNHVPATFVRAPRSAQWTRIDGFASPAMLLAQLRSVTRAG